MNVTRFILPLLGIALSGMIPGAVHGQTPDLVLTSGHAFSDSRCAAMAGSGIAIEGGISTALLNPALPNAYARDHELKLTTVDIGYGRDPNFDAHIAPMGISLTAPQYGTAGLFGRVLSADKNRNEYEAALTLSGRLFENNMNQGPVDLGVNVRYERSHWTTDNFDTLHAQDTLSGGSTNYVRTGDLQQDRIMIDIGFYQSRISDYVDFSLVLHNVFGYVWHKESPDTTRTSSSNGYLAGDYFTSKGWLPSTYKSLAAGIAFRTSIFEEKVGLIIPVDIEMADFFSGFGGVRFMARTGFEAKIREIFFLRFGYARAPRVYDRNSTSYKTENIFTGGAGVKLSIAQIDFNIGKDEWESEVGFEY